MAERWNSYCGRWEEAPSPPSYPVAQSRAVAEAHTKAVVPIMGSAHHPGLLISGDVHEPFAGAFQRAIYEPTENVTAATAVYACIWRISADVGKMRVKLIEEMPGQKDVWQEVRSGSPFLPVLRKPNRFQTMQQFLEHWMQSKLIYGNFYALKEYDNRGVVTGLYPLHPRCVMPLIADDGEIAYSIRTDNLAGVQQDEIVPADDIVHDRMMALFHPLVGIPPIYAASKTAIQALKIQAHSSTFFQNSARPSGMLIVPGNLSPEQRDDLKAKAEAGYSRENQGRVMILTGGMKFEPLTMPAEQSQLTEQLKLTSEMVAQAFGVPLYKLGIGQPTLNNLSALNQHYFADTIHPHVEAIESLLNLALSLAPYQTELDTKNLLRMDPEAQMSVLEKGVGSALISPDEGRNELNLPTVPGGKYPYLQQQNYNLAALAKRDANDPFAKPEPAPVAAPAQADEPDDEENAEAEARAFIEMVRKGFEADAVAV